jgi:hypothetical protein
MGYAGKSWSGLMLGWAWSMLGMNSTGRNWTRHLLEWSTSLSPGLTLILFSSRLVWV